jgi:soluble lytic murein transglycosylase-like protein
MRWLPILVALALGLMAAPRPVVADIYMYKDKNGVTHFTNIKPRRGKYRRLYKRGPGKASRKRCKGCDVVPAKDSSQARFTRYDKFIYGAARLYKIPVALIRAVIESESDYDPRVVSSAGAKGLMQLMPLTAKMMGVTDMFDPRENIYGGTRYLRVLANTFNGNLVLTVAGYHAGPGAVARYKGVPPYLTTHKYVRVVIRRYYKYQKREAASRKARLRTPRHRKVPSTRNVDE